MSGFLRGVASIVAIAAIVAPPLAPIASAVAVAASVGAQLTAKRPVSERQGLQLQFKIDPNSPIYWPVGRTAVGGVVVHRETFGTDNHYQTYFVDLGLGPGHGIETFLADRAAVAFSGTQAVGYYNKWMWQDRLLGATPESRALGHGVTSPPFGSIPAQVPGWSAAHKLSGHIQASLTLLFDTKARRYANGEPLPGWVVRGALAWDPRLDSTYPGGLGACRLADPATWPWTETPALIGLRWRLGLYQNGKRIMGVGAPVDLIDVARIVEAANVQEANGWKVGGELNSGMDRWEALKLIEQAGGAEPIANAALMSTLQKMPRVAVGEITDADIVGRASIPGSRPRRERINGFRARYRSEAHGWELVPIALVQIGDYVTADGVARSGSADYPLVQDKDQAAQLAAYEIYDSREIGPIELQVKPRFIGYRIGDALTAKITELGLVGQLVIVRGRRIDPATGIVTLKLVTETAGKHAEALGRTGVAPPVPVLTHDPLTVAPPSDDDWGAVGGTIEAGGYKVPALIITGAVASSVADGVVFDYREAGEDDWIGAAIEPADTTRKLITDVLPSTAYEVGIRYKVGGVIGERLVQGPIDTGGSSILELPQAQVFAQADEPTTAKLNDLWFKPSGDVLIYLGDGAVEQLAVEQDQLVTIGGDVIVFGAGGGWVLTTLSEKVLSVGGNLYFVDDDEPVATKIGDSWFSPVTGVLKWWSGGAWVATADRTAAVVPKVIGAAPIAIAANTSSITTTPLPLTRRLQAYEGTTDRSKQASFTLGALPGGIEATIDNVDGSADRGVLTLTRADASGPIPISVVFPGGGVETVVVQVVRTAAAAPVNGGGGGGTPGGYVAAFGWSQPVSDIFTIITPVLTIATGAGGTLAFEARASFFGPAQGEIAASIALKAAYRLAGSDVWNDAGPESEGSSGGNYSGYVSLSETVSGLADATTYEVALFARYSVPGFNAYWGSDTSFTVAA